MMILRSIRRSVLFLSLVSLAAPAVAQIWIGEFAARRAHEARELQRQRACEARLPAPDALAAKASARAMELVAMLQALPADPSPRQIKALFAKSRGPESVPRSILRESPEAQRLGFIVATDASTAIGIWRLGAEGSMGGTAQVVLIHFAYVPVSLIRSDWRIARIIDVPPGTQTPELQPYCRIDHVAALGEARPKH